MDKIDRALMAADEMDKKLSELANAARRAAIDKALADEPDNLVAAIKVFNQLGEMDG